MRSFSELVASISWSTAILERDSSLLRKLQLGNSRSSFEIPFGQGILQMHLQGEITRNCHATWVQVRIPKPWLVIDMKLILSSRLFLLALTEKQGKSIDCNGSSLPPFSIPSFLRILDISATPDGVVKFLESLCSSSSSRRACWQSKTFPEIRVFSRVFRGIPISRLGSPIELEVMRAWWGT